MLVFLIQQSVVADFSDSSSYVINSPQEFDDIKAQLERQLKIPFRMPAIKLKNKDGKELVPAYIETSGDNHYSVILSINEGDCPRRLGKSFQAFMISFMLKK